jgi:hypothetical protein
MAKNEFPFPEPAPSLEAENLNPPAESLTLAAAEIATRAHTTLSGFEEALARGDDRRYANHWGINE